MTGLTRMRLKPDTSGAVVYKPFSESDDFTEGWWDDAIHGFETQPALVRVLRRPA